MMKTWIHDIVLQSLTSGDQAICNQLLRGPLRAIAARLSRGFTLSQDYGQRLAIES